jgi:mannose-6-phosphate isomerase-like protein (cupin superfamily)
VTYLGEFGAASARVHRLAEQPTEPGVGSIVATGSVTQGDFGLFRGVMNPGAEVAGHFHRTFSESFYVLHGDLEFFDGDRLVDVTIGDLVYVPPGGIHNLKVLGETPAEVLTIFSPGIAREAFVYELREMTRTGRTLTPDEWTEFYGRHDQYMV